MCKQTESLPLFYFFRQVMVTFVSFGSFFSFPFFFNHHFYFPAQLVGGFTLSDLLDKPWSQVSSLPPGTCLQFLSRKGFSSVNFHRILLTHALVLSANQSQEKSPHEYVHSVRNELAKLILVGTRITYQATEDAFCTVNLNTTSSCRAGQSS